MSSIDMNSQLSTNHIEPTLIREKNEILCGRDWIEENLNYERRHRITDQIVDSAADFRKQNKTQCQASGYRHIVFLNLFYQKYLNLFVQLFMQNIILKLSD